jgi:hypothetical protein
MQEPVQIRVQGSPAAVAAAYARIAGVLQAGVLTTRPLRGGSGAVFGDFAAVVAEVVSVEKQGIGVSGRHGKTLLGDNFRDCTCAVQPCGGVAEEDMRPGCPEHDRNPVLAWHRAEACVWSAAAR